MKILFSNLGYAKGISGTLLHHMRYASRHFYAHPDVQRQVLAPFRAIIESERPDIACIVEIDRGSFQSGYFNQIQALMCGEYCFHDIADKYGEQSKISKLPLHKGKSNAFLSRVEFPFEKIYFSLGAKRLVYKITLPDNCTLFFAHFSLKAKVRAVQFADLGKWVKECKGEALVLADFNIINGPDELKDFLAGTKLKLMNRVNEATFRFHKKQMMLDLCLCSPALAERIKLQVIPQSFSDHAALLVNIT